MAQSSPLLLTHPHILSAMRVPDVPFELIEHTINHLHDDNASLSACAVVCKAWITPSHRHLFNTLHIVAGMDHQRFHQFVDFAPSSKYTCHNVRHLCLSHCPDSELPQPEDMASVEYDVTLLTSILSNIPRLQSLTISQICWKGSSISGASDVPNLRLPSLTKLTIGSLPPFHRLYHIQIVFDWFPSLAELSIDGGILVDPRVVMDAPSTYTAPQPLIPTTLHLTTLRYHSFVYAPFFIESISRSLSTRSLRFISTRITSLQSVIGTGDLLRIVGPVLEGLDLDLQFLFHDMTHVDSVERFQEGWILLGLECLTVLQSLTLTISTSTSHDNAIHSTGPLLLPLLLETVKSSKLRRFKLVFGNHEEPALGFIELGNDWSSSEVQLLRLETLKHVEFAYSPSRKFSEPYPISEGMLDRLKVALPTLTSKGLLKR